MSLHGVPALDMDLLDASNDIPIDSAAAARLPVRFALTASALINGVVVMRHFRTPLRILDFVFRDDRD